ncbi:hypothetical protein JHK82_037711 [Glycine max]|nr:hypothetical protein JHK86_037908 [Glycine max]KAG5114442.1 hypothetical protein JHK82_037711 [Glycine max]
MYPKRVQISYLPLHTVLEGLKVAPLVRTPATQVHDSSKRFFSFFKSISSINITVLGCLMKHIFIAITSNTVLWLRETWDSCGATFVRRTNEVFFSWCSIFDSFLHVWNHLENEYLSSCSSPGSNDDTYFTLGCFRKRVRT